MRIHLHRQTKSQNMASKSKKVYQYTDFVLVTDIDQANEEYNVLKQFAGLQFEIVEVKRKPETVNLKISLNQSVNEGYKYSEKEWTLERLYDLCDHWFENFHRNRIIKVTSRKTLLDKEGLTAEQRKNLYIPPSAIFIFNHKIEVENVLKEQTKTFEKVLHYCIFEEKNHPLYSEYCDITILIDTEAPKSILSHQCELSLVHRGVKCDGCITIKDILQKHVLPTTVAILKTPSCIHYIE